MSPTTTLPADIEALADSLSACANELHQRIMRAIRRNGQDRIEGGEDEGNEAGGGAASGITQADAQALFDQEVALRQSANSLYVDSARLAVAGLAIPGQQLLSLAARARETIRRIDRAKEIAGIAGSLIGVAAAILSAHPQNLATALETLDEHLDALKDESLQKPGTTMKT
ncbi:hypothetical protein [Pseudoduganella buxea]|uniref:Uncharacterized protein n=1 Tax=Pseudoduganella buxea TaxID=1949069 RepID=A0A6I3T2K5_9BURK|nr:hypothetical protein [Pseudoduganella buxea]MTV53847.1 hypothetical protein [Pseudoduganella buxea]GGC01286.1 hypothetical protein GCM10011572_24060 [Pseudoduganella buxea]